MSNIPLPRKMSKKQKFMDLQLPFSVTSISKKKSSDLLEPIKHDDEITIQRLISIHHTRSFTSNNYDENEEEKIYKQKRNEILNSIVISDEDEPYDNENNNSKMRRITYTLPSHTVHTVTHRQSFTHNEDITDIEAMHRVLNEHKSYSNDIDEDDTERLLTTRETILTIPLHENGKPRNKIQRDKTPLPEHKKKRKNRGRDKHRHNLNLKIELSEQKYDQNEDKQLKFQSISGDLEKKSASKFVGWQKRWFYLWKDKLDYYKESSLQIRGSISLWDVEYVGIVDEYNMGMTSTGVPTVSKNKHHKLNKFTFQIAMKRDKHINNGGRIYYIRGKNKNIRDEWIKIINNNLNVVIMVNNRHGGHGSRRLGRDRNSSKYKRDRSAVLRSKSIGCKHKRGHTRRQRNKSVPSNVVNVIEIISFLDVCNYSNTGDVLLFDTKSKSGACVRVATGGNYDHIGMIFRLKDGKVGVLEALGSGVQVFLWKNFRKYNWNNQYSRIGFRSLIIPDSNLRKEIKRKLTQFVKTVVNRHYGWNPIALIRKQSTVSLYDESRTFFCSELIAKAFKEAGLLRSDLASSQYFPSHFQQSKNMTLLKGCSFSNEMSVRWTENDLKSIDIKSDQEINGNNINNENKSNNKNYNNHKFKNVNNNKNNHKSNNNNKPKKKARKQRAKTAAVVLPLIQTVSLHHLHDKKQKLKSPPPRQLF
eukprot:195312_1